MKIICANFKMNLLKKDIIDYLNTIKNKNLENVVFFPNNIYIEEFRKNNYLVGSQDISFQEFGAVTGDTSIFQLKELGINYTLIGHSERREYFNDNNYISKKISLALKNDIKVILCIGENKTDFLNKQTFDILKEEIEQAFLNNLDLINDNNLIIAYEPIWAIGTGIIPTNDILEETIDKIKKYLKEKYNLNLKVLYGGSVKLDNIESLEKISNIDGYLIGGACLNPDKFLSLIDKVN